MKFRDKLTTSPCHTNGLGTDDQKPLNAVRTEIKFLLAPRIRHPARRHGSDFLAPIRKVAQPKRQRGFQIAMFLTVPQSDVCAPVQS